MRLRLEIRANKADAETVARIQTVRPDWLVVAKDTGYTVTCLRCVPGILGLVVRETWSPDGRNLKATIDWHMPGSETGRWEVLAARPEWTDWPKHGRREEYLSEPEYQQLLAEARELILRQKTEGDWKTFVAVTASNDALYLHGVRNRDCTGSQGRARVGDQADPMEAHQRNRQAGTMGSLGHALGRLCLDPAEDSPNEVEKIRTRQGAKDKARCLDAGIAATAFHGCMAIASSGLMRTPSMSRAKSSSRWPCDSAQKPALGRRALLRAAHRRRTERTVLGA